MSLHFFIDGHNLLHATDRWDDTPRVSRRLRLVADLDEERPAGSERNTVTVVFDGHEPRPGFTPLKFTRVLFSGDKDADTVIRELVNDHPHPKTTVVVTNDKSIQLHVRKRGAKILSCEEFLLLCRKPAAFKHRHEKVSPDTAGEITDELKRLWKV